MLIDRLWKSQPGKFFFLCTKNSRGEWKEHCFKRKELSDVEEFITNNKDKDVWFCPHGFSKNRRLKPYAVPGTVLWADLDEADPRELELRPTVAIESSPGRYVGLWITDSDIDEDINRRLTYAIEADVSGWDYTQVLRVPGTTNYKYKSQPRVRTLWVDGPEWSLKKLTKLLPDEVEENNGSEESDAAEVFKAYEKKMPAWLRRELVAGKPTAGKRSEMIWKLNQSLIELGCARDEIFVMLKASPWNKFAGRRNEEDQLRREIEKGINKHLKANATKSEKGSSGDYNFLAETMEDVEEENIDWIWYPYLARGELTILEGDPGVGKSYLAQMVGLAICDGDRLPSVKKMSKVEGRVAAFDLENARGTITKKRLVENGIENPKNYIQDEEPFTIDDVDKLESVFEAIERVRPVLVIFDTLNAYIGRADTNKASESTQALGIFREIARRFGCAVLVIRHLTKGTKTTAMYRGQGSIAFSGMARVVMTCGKLPDDPETCAMAITKINVAKAPRALTYRVVALPDTLKSQDRSKFVWGEFVDLTSDDLVGDRKEEKNTDKEDAVKWLSEALEDSDQEIKRLEKMAEVRGVSIRTLHRAAEEIGVKKKQTGFGKDKKSVWSLP